MKPFQSYIIIVLMLCGQFSCKAPHHLTKDKSERTGVEEQIEENTAMTDQQLDSTENKNTQYDIIVKKTDLANEENTTPINEATVITREVVVGGKELEAFPTSSDVISIEVEALGKNATDRFSILEEKEISEQPPVRMFRVRFKIQNNNQQAVWYLMPYSGSTALPQNGRFEVQKLNQELSSVISVVKYQATEAHKELIELRFVGKEQQHFRAFYIPAQSSFTLSNYTIDCWQDTDKVELWAVQELSTNHPKFLQDYLPFSVLSSQNLVVKCDRENGCQWEAMDWAITENALENRVKTEVLSYIQAQKVKKYKIQLTK